MKWFTVFALAIMLAVSAFAIDVFIDESLRHLNLKPVVVERKALSSTAEVKRSENPLIDLKFGKLSRTQFEGLQEFYLNRSFVKYSSEKTYFLTDFLTPQMQALNGLDFNDQLTAKEITGLRDYMHGDDSRDKTTIHSTAQCWGTAWNNIVSLQADPRVVTPFEIGYLGTQMVEALFLSDEHSLEVPKNTPYKFGDVMAMVLKDASGTAVPAHFPVYIGFGMVFEKEDSRVGNPFRTVRLKDSFNGLKATAGSMWRHKDDEVLLIPRRFLGIDRPKLPKLSRVSNAWNSEGYAIFGRTAARMTVFVEQGLGGGFRAGAGGITKIPFDINTWGNGILPARVQAYFTPAYLTPMFTCQKLFQK